MYIICPWRTLGALNSVFVQLSLAKMKKRLLCFVMVRSAFGYHIEVVVANAFHGYMILARVATNSLHSYLFNAPGALKLPPSDSDQFIGQGNRGEIPWC